MPPLAQRNLFHDKVRLTVTLTGIVFAVVLIVVELGLFFGFTVTTSNLIDHAGADLWVTSPKVPYVEMGVPFSERKLNQIRAVPGVGDAEKLVARWAQWKLHDGSQESVQIIGANPDSLLGRPWNLVEGRAEDLKDPDAVILDEIYKKKLGVTRVGEVFEVGGHRARVVGFTRGIRSFTTSPFGGSVSKFGHVHRSGRKTQADRTDLYRLRRALSQPLQVHDCEPPATRSPHFSPGRRWFRWQPWRNRRCFFSISCCPG